jgi:hypothetical protein
MQLSTNIIKFKGRDRLQHGLLKDFNIPLLPNGQIIQTPQNQQISELNYIVDKTDLTEHFTC